MRLVFIAMAVLGLVNCTAEDRRFLLTYDHPKMHEAAMAQPVIVQVSASNSAIITSEGTRVEIQEAPPPFTPEQPRPGTAAIAPTASSAKSVSAQTRQPATTPAHVVKNAISVHRASEQTGAERQLAAVPPPRHPVARTSVTRAKPVTVPPAMNDAVNAPAAAASVEPAPSTAAAIPAAAVAPSAAPAGVSGFSAVQAAAEPAPVSAAAEAHCRALARQRKDDARANYYDGDTQQQIFDGTYASCIDWEGKHS